MVEMNPFYAHASEVGNVFDVATWSPRKALTTFVVGLLAGGLFGAAALYIYAPGHITSLVLEEEHVPRLLREANEGLSEAHQSHAWPMWGGIGFLALLSFVCVSGACNRLVDYFNGDFYFRAGPGGFSICVPADGSWKRMGLHPGLLKKDIPFAAIERWKVVQEKEFGSLSPNAGNLAADMTIYLHDGTRYAISLDMFREPARIIYKRIHESVEMSVASLEPETEILQAEALVAAGHDA